MMTNTINYQMLCLKVAGWVANSEDPEEMPHSVASNMVLHCLFRPVHLNTHGKYNTCTSFQALGRQTLLKIFT